VLTPPFLSSSALSELGVSVELLTRRSVGAEPFNASWKSELLVPKGPSRPMEGTFQPPIGLASAAALPAPSARATTAAVTVDQLRIDSPGVEEDTELST
jgi:hypothetical protein